MYECFVCTFVCMIALTTGSTALALMNHEHQDVHIAMSRPHHDRHIVCCGVCCSALQCVAVCCSALQCVAVCCRVSSTITEIIAAHCNALQHATTHCNTLQHTATHGVAGLISRRLTICTTHFKSHILNVSRTHFHKSHIASYGGVPYLYILGLPHPRLIS